MSKLFIPVLLGTAREGRESEKAARFVFAELEKEAEVKTELIDVREIVMSETIPSWVDSPVTAKWKEIMKAADALVIVTPEYNRGYPGELKLLLDSALKEYKKKPVAVCGVSDGLYGGARVVELMKPSLTHMGLVPISRVVLVNNVDTLFDETGKIKEAENWQKKTKGLFEELLWYSKVLKEGREIYPEKNKE